MNDLDLLNLVSIIQNTQDLVDSFLEETEETTEEAVFQQVAALKKLLNSKEPVDGFADKYTESDTETGEKFEPGTDNEDNPINSTLNK